MSIPTTLIARRGYSGMGSMGDYIATSDYVETGDVASTIEGAGSSILGVFTGAASAQGMAQADKAIYAQQQANALPTWFMPLALIGGIGVIAVMISRRKSAARAAARASAPAAPVSNPARRRRARRRHRRARR